MSAAVISEMCKAPCEDRLASAAGSGIKSRVSTCFSFSMPRFSRENSAIEMVWEPMLSVMIRFGPAIRCLDWMTVDQFFGGEVRGLVLAYFFGLIIS